MAANKVTINETNNTVEISAPGPQGAQGPTGPHCDQIVRTRCS